MPAALRQWRGISTRTNNFRSIAWRVPTARTNTNFEQNNLRAKVKRFAPWHETIFEKDVDLLRFSDKVTAL